MTEANFAEFGTELYEKVASEHIAITGSTCQIPCRVCGGLCMVDRDSVFYLHTGTIECRLCHHALRLACLQEDDPDNRE